MKKALILLGVLALCFVSFTVGGLYSIFGNTNAEYRTMQLMGHIETFIDTNGRWPKGWEEIGVSPFPGVQVTWDVPLVDLDEWKIHKLINVKTKKWYVYPYYERHVESLAAVVRQVRERTADPPSPPTVK